MRKRLLITGLLTGLLIVITLLLLKYVIDLSLRKPVLHEEFTSIVPATPLAYIQCSQLKTRLEQFTNSPDYLTFIQSEFAKQVQQTEWWSDFSFSFEQFWNSIIIDPMRIIGTDVAIAVYNAEEGEVIPGVILVSKVDRITKIAERVLYAFDRVSGQIGITFDQNYQRFPIYVIEQPDMICPLYYTIIDDIGMISTSLPLLKNTIRLALSKVEGSAIGADERPVEPSPFRKTIRDIPDKRFVTCYLDLPLFLDELRENIIFQPLGLFQGSVWEEGRDFPFVTIRLDTYVDKIILRTELFSGTDILGDPGSSSEDEGESPCFQDGIPANLPVVMALYKKNLTSFFQNWQDLFPQWEWVFPIQTPDRTQDIFGERIECRVSDALLGTLYTIPDISCVLDTQRPGLSRVFLTATINNMLDQMLSPMVQRTVKMSNEPYRSTVISKIQLMFQEILSYATAKSDNKRSQNGYTILATNVNVLKNRIDSLQAHSEPYVFAPQPGDVAFMVLLKNDGLSELIQNISQTNTFALLYPRHTHRQLYQLLPLLIQFLKPLPPVLIEGGTKGTRLYLELRSQNLKKENSKFETRISNFGFRIFVTSYF